MIDLAAYPDGVWLIDFEYHPAGLTEGNNPMPVCMVVQDFDTGDQYRHWGDELQQMECAPFPTGPGALFVAYFAQAEMNCFLALRWPLPTNVLDLFAEFRCLTNGMELTSGAGLLGALIHFGLPGITDNEKNAWRQLILSGGPWSQDDARAIMDYCASDVVGLQRLLTAMQPAIDGLRALLRGRYARAVAHIETHGTPIDVGTLQRLTSQWVRVQGRLIEELDQEFQVYDGRTFKAERFELYLVTHGIPWPRLPSGALLLKDAVFADMGKAYPQLQPLRELRAALSKTRQLKLSIGSDNRSRAMISPFGTITGRNTPSSVRFIFGPPAWVRSLIKPTPGAALAYLDYSQQEFGIAAALSEDPAMMDAYLSGDPYLEFARQAGAVPGSATKVTHAHEREQFKACSLAVQYGMGAESLSLRIKQPVARARQLLDLHRRTYKTFWQWSDSAVHEALLGGRLWSTFGWQLFANADPNTRSLRNFPMQANGAEMLRLACIFLTEAGIKVCAPVHDAVLIEAPLWGIDETARLAQTLMADASRIVLSGFTLRSDVKFVRYPDRYVDDRGVRMWDLVMKILDEPHT